MPPANLSGRLLPIHRSPTKEAGQELEKALAISNHLRHQLDMNPGKSV